MAEKPIFTAYFPENAVTYGLSLREFIEGGFDEMHEQGQGYLADSLRQIGSQRFKNPTAFEMGVIEGYDLLPFDIQNKPLSPSNVDQALSVFNKSIVKTNGALKADIGWFKRSLDERISEWQMGRSQLLRPRIYSQRFILGSDGVFLAFGLSKYIDRKQARAARNK